MESRDRISNFCLRDTNLTSLEYVPAKLGGVAAFSWSKTMPVLRLLQVPYDFILFDEDEKSLDSKKVTRIIKKYRFAAPKKKAILDAQKELFDKGYYGNAKW